MISDNQNLSLFKKVTFLLNSNQKKKLLYLILLLIVGIFFEMLSLGIMIPILGIIMTKNLLIKYPFLKKYIDAIGNPSQTQLTYIVLLILVLIFLVKTIFLLYSTKEQSKFSGTLSAELAQGLFLGYLRQPYSFHLKRNSSELLRNIQTEVASFNNVTQAFITLSVEISTIIGISFMLIFVEPIGTILVISFLAASTLLFHQLTKKKLLKWGENRQFHVGLMNQHLMQGLGGVKEVKLAAKEKYFFKEFNKHYNKFTETQIKVTTLGFVPRMYLELLSVIGLSTLIIIMVWQGKDLDSLLPILGVFVASAFRMIPSANRIMVSLQQVRFSKPVINLIYKEFTIIRNEDIKINEIENNKEFNFTYKISLNNLNYKYPESNNNALDQISLEIIKGKSCGIIGQSGSGKTTLIDLLLGMLPSKRGMITIDDKFDINFNLASWQKKIGYVPQNIYLTDDSLLNNIAFGIEKNKIDYKAINTAIKSAQLVDFIEQLPHGLDTSVGERGVRISGGQRQRIGIARALYHNPEILILDEATSALDLKTEKEVMNSINSLHGFKTIIIVAHRLSTLKDCDIIFKLEGGKLTEKGAPEKILI